MPVLGYLPDQGALADPPDLGSGDYMATTLRYVTIVRERWRAALITALIVLGAIVAAASLQRPEYEASASIFVRTGTGASVMDRAAAADYVSQQIETYTDLVTRSEEHTSELQSRGQLVCRLLLEKKKTKERNT